MTVLDLKIGIPIQQEFSNPHMSSHGCFMQWSLSMMVLNLNVRTLGQQKPHFTDVTVARRNKQKIILRILEKLRNPGMPTFLRPIQWSPVSVILDMEEVGIPLQQQLDNLHMPGHGRAVQRGPTLVVLNLNVRALVQQQSHLTDIPALHRIKQKSILRILEKVRSLCIPTLLCPIQRDPSMLV